MSVPAVPPGRSVAHRKGKAVHGRRHRSLSTAQKSNPCPRQAPTPAANWSNFSTPTTTRVNADERLNTVTKGGQL